jgi:hypothetical protein
MYRAKAKETLMKPEEKIQYNRHVKAYYLYLARAH